MGYKQGGFALLSPYHSAKTGVLTKMLMDYRHGTAAIDIQETETFSASDRVKLLPHGWLRPVLGRASWTNRLG